MVSLSIQKGQIGNGVYLTPSYNLSLIKVMWPLSIFHVTKNMMARPINIFHVTKNMMARPINIFHVTKNMMARPINIFHVTKNMMARPINILNVTILHLSSKFRCVQFIHPISCDWF